ncbi:MAG: hypothetical protein P1U57_10735 [Oleibacter sp.]|nr:hypothetical protein [Thalassolituus sp.]
MKYSIFILLVLVTGFAQADVLSTGSVGQPPRIIIDEKPVPVAKAPEDKKVMLVDLELQFEKGELVETTSKSSRTIVSYAPKVFSKKSGEWQILLNGNQELSFYTHNPGIREIQPGGDTKDYSWTTVTGTVDWPLVIPLYKDKQSFNVESFQIVDVATKKVIADINLK